MIETLALLTLLSAIAESGRRSRHAEVVRTLEEVTDLTMDRMQRQGWFGGPSRERRFDRPTEWDINCGDCEEWAMDARKRLGGKILWLDQVLDVEPEDVCHCVLALDDRYYDAQHPDGVEDVRELDLMKGVSREEFISRRESRWAHSDIGLGTRTLEGEGFRHLPEKVLARSSKLEARSSPVTDEQRRHYNGLVTKLQGWWKKVDPTREGLEEPQIRSGLRKLKILDDLVGAGSVRVVLDVGDGALKIATVEGDNWINLEEAKVWDEAPPQIRRWLVPVLAVASDGSWLLMELADPAPGSLPRGAADELKEYGIVDIYSYNISLDGRLLDYAHRLEYDR